MTCGHRRNLKATSVPLLGALALIGGMQAEARAQETTAPRAYYACYVPVSGVVYLIREPGMPEACRSPNHVLINLTQLQVDLTSGNVGIGTDEPEAALDVAGDIHASGELRIGNTIIIDDATNSITSTDGTISFFGDEDPTTTGIVGIGVFDPSTHLEVAGNVRADTIWGYTFIGDGSGLTGVTADNISLEGVHQVVNGFAVTGESGIGAIPVEGPGVRMLWYPGKAAFRAGRVNGTQWDDANVGSGSTAMGSGTIASGTGSTALGSGTIASGIGSTALGESVRAEGDSATAMGVFTLASGFSSTAMGSGTTATGYSSTAMGFATTATGGSSTALGYQTTAQAYASLAIGKHNVVAGDPLVWNGGDPLLVAGNGTAGSPSDALTLYKNGNLAIAGTLTQSSDARLKLGIEPLGPALEQLRDITPVRFRFREGTGHPTHPQIGLLAQEVAEAFPELVSTDSEGYLSLAYPQLTAVLLRAIQEQQVEIEALQAERRAVDDRIARLEDIVQRLVAGSDSASGQTNAEHQGR